MDYIIFVSPFLFLSILFSCGLAPEYDPIIVLRRGVIENDGLLPISVFWYYPNISKEALLWVYTSDSQEEYTFSLKLESYTGSYNLPRAAPEHNGNLDKYCSSIFSNDGILYRSHSCGSKVQWMYDRKYLLKEFSLRGLVIPGTHQSAAFTPINRSLNDQSLISRWIHCQTTSIKSQLMDGIRYLDLRPAAIYKGGKKEYTVTHNVLELMSMDDVVNQINEFMEISKDIVIVSFREFFKGFYSDEDHRSFIEYLEHSFKEHAHQREMWSYKLRKIWNDDKRLIISYDHHTYNSSNFMWPPIMQYWSDAQTISRLHTYLYQLHRSINYVAVPYATMVTLTHSVTTAIQDLFQRDMSLRHWAERLGKYIPQWYSEEWSKTANVIAVDFYQTSGIVDLAIHLNERRIRYPHYGYKK